MEGNQDNQTGQTLPEQEPTPSSVSPVSSPTPAMAAPPRDILADANALTDAGGGRVITPEQQKALSTPAPGAVTATEPVARTGQFGAKNIAPNEFKITHQGKDLGGKTLTPTEVSVVLGWLNSLPAD